MLTVDYGRLGLRRGERLLDLGCGGGRHAFQAARLGARVVALDADDVEVKHVRDTIGAMLDAGEIRSDDEAGAVQGDALHLPFADASFDRVIAAEVLEHIPEDGSAMAELSRVLEPGGTMAVTVPRFGPEAVNWALSNEYHDVPGGHVRIYRRSTLVRAPRGGPACAPSARHHAHALHSPYWWLRVPGGPRADDHSAGARLSPAARVGHHQRATRHPGHRAASSTRCSGRVSSSTWRSPHDTEPREPCRSPTCCPTPYPCSPLPRWWRSPRWTGS